MVTSPVRQTASSVAGAGISPMIALSALAVWVYLFFCHGFFWRSEPELGPRRPIDCPPVDIVVPARDEAATIRSVVESLLAQDYPGRFRVIVVDDNSSDDTATLAGAAPNLRVLRLTSKPAGWTGKLWALECGVAASEAPLLLFTDADIVHDPRHLSALAAHLLDTGLGMVSEMVGLNCSSLAERATVPAFVYFFQMLYPFSAVNDPSSKLAAAAGGTVLIRRDTLRRIGGVEVIKHALIDDVTLAKAVKGVSNIYLGHTRLARSVRPYPAFSDVWQMIARTAFTQLRYSLPLLGATLLGLALVWLVPPLAAIFGRHWTRAAGIAACLLAYASYLPTLNRYRINVLWGMTLPFIALFYMAATVDSAFNHWRGSGARWKARSYDA